MSEQCLVTGAGGFIGSALTAALATNGQRVRAVVRRPGLALPDDGPAAQSNEQVNEYVINDLTKAAPDEFARLLTGCDTVIHLAARTHMPGARPLTYESLNVGVTEQLALAAASSGVRHFVFVSSVKAIGEETRDTPFSPKTTEAPEDDYGRTKLKAEQILLEAARRADFRLSIVRPPLIYGSGAPGNLARLIHLVQKGIPLPLASIENRRSMLSRNNLVDLLVQITERPTDRVILPADIHLSTPALVKAIARSLNRVDRLIPMPAGLLEALGRLTGQYQQVRRLTRSLEISDPWLANAFGWTPAFDADKALAAMVTATLTTAKR